MGAIVVVVLNFCAVVYKCGSQEYRYASQVFDYGIFLFRDIWYYPLRKSRLIVCRRYLVSLPPLAVSHKECTRGADLEITYVPR